MLGQVCESLGFWYFGTSPEWRHSLYVLFKGVCMENSFGRQQYFPFEIKNQHYEGQCNISLWYKDQEGFWFIIEESCSDCGFPSYNSMVCVKLLTESLHGSLGVWVQAVSTRNTYHLTLPLHWVIDCPLSLTEKPHALCQLNLFSCKWDKI